MSQMTISQLEAFLTQLEDKEIKPQFQEEATFYNMVSVNTSAQFVNGKGYKLHPYLRPDGSNAYFSEGGSFPAGGTQNFSNFYVFPLRYAKSFEVSGDYLEDLQSGQGSLLSFAEYIQMLNTSAIHELEEQMFGDGTGTKSTSTTTSTSTWTGATAAATLYGSTKGTTQLLDSSTGAIYDHYNSSGTLVDAGVTFSSVSFTASTATPTVAFSSNTAGDVLVWAGSYAKVPRGLAYIVNNDTGVFQSLSRSTNQMIRSVVEDATNAGITVQIVSKLKKKLKYRSGVEAGGGLTVVTSLQQMDGYERLGYNLRRFGANDSTFDQSFEKIKHGDSQFIPALSCDEDRMYFLDMPDIQRYERKAFGFYDKDGLKLRQKAGSNATGADAWYGNIGAKYTVGCKTPKNHGLIKRLSGTDLASMVGSWA